MIQIQNVSFRYAACEADALHNINLHIQKGEFVVLLGDSGCGKTTITRLINRLVPEFFDGDLRGTIIVDGINTAEQSIQDLTETVGSVFQDPRSQFFTTDTTAEIAFSCENIGLPREELHFRIEKAANDLKITRLLDRSIFELSSGEKQAVAVASVYALSPKIFVLDEPSANLDAAATIHLMNILHDLKKQGYTIIVSEHRIHYLREIADRAILIENGRIVKELSGEEFKGMSNESANGMALRSIHLVKVNPSGISIQQKDEGLRLNKVSFHYGKKNEPLRDISFCANKGSIVGIIGNNGVGKSTLLEIVCGLKKIKTGKIFLNGAPVSEKERIKRSYLVMQDSDYQLFTESVEKELSLGIKSDSRLLEKGNVLLKRMGLSELAARHPASLSGGQKQRLCIAVSCMKGADVICLDEPTSGLDYRSMKSVSALLHELADEEKTVLLTSHDYEFLITTCTHICYLKDGIIQQFFDVNGQSVHKIYNILNQKEDKQ